MRKKTKLILALDETDELKATWIAEQVNELVDAIKVNWPLVLSASPSIIERLSKISKVICDFKVADIPNTNRLIVQEARERGASGVIVHAFPGRDSVRAAVEAARDIDIFVVTEMSHPGGQEFTAPFSEKFAQIAVECGASGVIAPATRPETIGRIRSIVREKLILSPGVGIQGGSASSAIRMGADYVIVGRSIYEDKDPRKAAGRIVDEISSM